jgi:organic hydroperoxide reductase OsmC/OhrA
MIANGSSPLDLDGAWTPEHLVLAGLVRCTLKSLRFHAAPLGIDFVANASSSAMVTRRPGDGRYAFVEIEVELELELEPAPPGEGLAALIAKAERDCFVGASLNPSPRYTWRVNGIAL